MAIASQGTMLYTIDPDTGAVFEIDCVISLDGIDTTNSTIDTTCLSARARTYIAGLAEPGAATFTINSDPQEESHIRLFQLKQAGTVLPWAVGWSDGDSVPTSALNTNGDYEFVTTAERSWILFEGFMTAYPFSFTGNSVVNSAVGIQVSGDIAWIPAAS